MGKNGSRWDPCVSHYGDDIDEFLNEYLARRDRTILLVSGIGFDPRSGAIADRIAGSGAVVRTLLVREHRPISSKGQRDRANQNRNVMLAKIPESREIDVEIFGSDDAVDGGRNVIEALRQEALESVTDVVVDISALSVGISFPIVRYFFELIESEGKPQNLHVVFAHDPKVDTAIRSIPGVTPGYVHGFKGGSTLSNAEVAAKLWLPQLASRRRLALRRLHDFLVPHDTCPILPFPASDPRRGDELVEEYLTELENTWRVDARNIVYADESDPLDLYRTILRLDDLRRPVFEATGGSMLILSPLGGKAVALGALLAAVERDLPVAYIEPIEYVLDPEMPQQISAPNLVHVWLEGDAYPQPRPALRRADNSRE